MSTIYQPSQVRSDAPPIHAKSQATPPAPAVVSDKAMDDLLQSGPNSDRQPMRPDETKMTPEGRAIIEGELKELSAQLTPATVELMMRHPESDESKAHYDKIDRVLTPDNIKGMLAGKNAASCRKTLAKIETQLKKESIDTALDPISNEQVEAYRRHVESILFDLKVRLIMAPDEKRFEIASDSFRKEDPRLTSIQHYINDVYAKSKHLYDIATEVHKAIGALQIAHPEGLEPEKYREPDHAKHSKTYSFSNTAASTLEHPSEIRNFVADRDKIDVTGISKQLNKPLHWVNQLSGASGEMQLKYSRENNASVLVISGIKGEPALVAKIFGQVKEKDLLI
ncbi:M10 family metallopeptidase C-terminal domain-containing protein [Pseudomonas sp. E2-15]